MEDLDSDEDRMGTTTKVNGLLGQVYDLDTDVGYAWAMQVVGLHCGPFPGIHRALIYHGPSHQNRWINL